MICRSLHRCIYLFSGSVGEHVAGVAVGCGAVQLTKAV